MHGFYYLNNIPVSWRKYTFNIQRFQTFYQISFSESYTLTEHLSFVCSDELVNEYEQELEFKNSLEGAQLWRCMYFWPLLCYEQN